MRGALIGGGVLEPEGVSHAEARGRPPGPEGEGMAVKVGGKGSVDTVISPQPTRCAISRLISPKSSSRIALKTLHITASLNGCIIGIHQLAFNPKSKPDLLH